MYKAITSITSIAFYAIAVLMVFEVFREVIFCGLRADYIAPATMFALFFAFGGYGLWGMRD